MTHSRPKWLRKVALLEQWLLVLSLSLIIIFSFLQIVLRNFWGTAIYWIDPLTRHLVLALMVIGGARAADRLSHLRIDLLSVYLPQKWKRTVNRLSWLAATLVSLILALAGKDFVQQAYQWNDGTQLTRTLLWFIPLGFGLISFHFAMGVIWPEAEAEEERL